MKEISAGGVVYRYHQGNVQFLLLQDRFGTLSLPKGKQEPGETIEQTALREVKEETGIDGQIVRFIERIHYEYKHKQHGKVQKEVHYYLIRALSTKITAQLEEVDAAFWVDSQTAISEQQAHGYGNNDSVIQAAARYMNQDLQLAASIDHTLLHADVQPDAVHRLCDEAVQYGFASVCIPPMWVQTCTERLKGKHVRVCTVIGFPLGNHHTQTKAFEAKQAIQDGADEVDMVLAVGAFIAGNEEYVRKDIRAVRHQANEATLKVIIETSLLNDAQKRRACQLAVQEGADFVKTSTGFSSAGATVKDIRLMHETIGGQAQIKASGGIRDKQTARAMLAAGATRLGASKSVAIMNGDEQYEETAVPQSNKQY